MTSELRYGMTEDKSRNVDGVFFWVFLSHRVCAVFQCARLKEEYSETGICVGNKRLFIAFQRSNEGKREGRRYCATRDKALLLAVQCLAHDDMLIFPPLSTCLNMLSV